ncbi:MAG: hypothetical protein AAF851_13680 [Myxococcota bacterium]
MTSLSPSKREPSIRELRRLLFEAELKSLRTVQQAVGDPTERRVRIEQDLSKLLNSLSPAELRALAHDLRPVTKQTLALVARDAPDELGRILAPSLGPFIRSYVRVLMSGAVEGLAKLLENALTLKSLRWRWEAWTTGRSLGEVALYHSLLYRVKRVLLIHEPTGALLCAASAEENEIDDDLVSGMLTAFRSFMTSVESSDIDASDLIQSGPHAFLVQQNGALLMALQVEGVVRPRLTDQLAETLDAIARSYSGEVEDFRGDTTPFEAARPKLEACLLFEARQPGTRRWTKMLAASLLILLFLSAVGLVGYRVYRGVLLDRYLDALAEAPGLIVTGHENRWLQSELEGLRDPNAPAPSDVWRDSGAADGWLGDPPQERWTPVLLSSPEQVERRLAAAFAASEDLIVSVDETGTAQLKGRVAPKDQLRLSWLHPAWVGLEAIDRTGLEGTPEGAGSDGGADVDALVKALEAVSIPFAISESETRGDQPLLEAIALLKRLDRGLTTPTQVEVIGRADPSGPENLNQRLRVERAAHVLSFIRTGAWRHLRFAPMAASPVEDEASSPSVRFRVRVP